MRTRGPPVPDEPLRARRENPLRAFVVEDSPLILERLVTTLEELAPVRVVGTAADEASAVAWLERDGRRCDLVLVDIFLRSGTGLGVLRAATNLSVSGRRVVLTNYATADIREACGSLGADRVFDKSAEIEGLLDYCERLHQRGGPATGTGPWTSSA
ncbi:MAG: response regulator transcription factor [Burkholderiales bacterium]|nr:response regulator transcription factor [Burkholderiales bacterium]